MEQPRGDECLALPRVPLDENGYDWAYATLSTLP